MATDADVERAISRRGLDIAFEHRGDPGFVFVHANGFCKEVWRPVIDAFGDPGYISIDQPGHGGSEAPDPPFDWWEFGRNALAVMEAVGVEEPIGVGHSSGAATLAAAEILQPGTFERLVLFEPIIPPPPYRRVEAPPLIEGALKRRTVFESADDAADAYRGRGPFARWDERALRAYVDHGFARTDRGWELRCRPDVEVEVYRTSEAHRIWERVGEIGCRVDLVVGADSDTHTEEFERRLAGRMRNATVHVVDGASHFVPMEQPDAVARIVHGA